MKSFVEANKPISDCVEDKVTNYWTPINCLESAKDDKKLLIYRPTLLVDPDGDGPKLPHFPYILFMKLEKGHIKYDPYCPLVC